MISDSMKLGGEFEEEQEDEEVVSEMLMKIAQFPLKIKCGCDGRTCVIEKINGTSSDIAKLRRQSCQ